MSGGAKALLTPVEVAEVARLMIDALHCCDSEAQEIADRISGRRGQPCQHPDGVQVLDDAEKIIRRAAKIVADEIRNEALQLTATT